MRAPSLRLGQPRAAQRALMDYSALVPLGSMDATLLTRLARARLQSGDREAARRAVQTALEKDPANADALELKHLIG